MRAVGVLVILLAATGAAQAGHDIAIAPSPIRFGIDGDTAIGGGPPGELQFGFFELENTGTKKLVVTDMAITGPDAGIMAFDGVNDPFCGSGQDCRRNFSLAPGEQRGFSLTCTPAQPGVFSASLVVKSNAAHSTTVAMSCLGNHPPVIAISPSSLDFGIVHICQFRDSCDPCAQPVTRTVTITNLAPAPSELDFLLAPMIPSGPSQDFTVTPSIDATQTDPLHLAAGQSFSIDITFHPRHSGASLPGPLTLVSLFPGQAPVPIPFHAEGGEGRLAFDTPSGLGSAVFGQTLITSITAHNAGNSCLTIDEFDLLGDCLVTGSDPPFFTLQAGEAFTRTIACTPTLDSFGSAELEVDCPFENQDVVLEGFQVDATGGALVLDFNPLEFTGPSAVTVGTSATVRTGVTNVGNDSTELVSITSTNPLFTAALVDASLPLALGAGESAAIDVTFTPAAAVSASGAIGFDVSIGLGATLDVAGDGVPADAGGMPRARRAATAEASALQPQVTGCTTTGGAGLPLILGVLCLAVRRRRRA